MYRYLLTFFILFTSLLFANTYSIKLGKFSKKSEVDARIDEVSPSLQNDIKVSYHAPYYFAITKPYKTEDMANVKMFILKQYFPDAFVVKESKSRPTTKSKTKPKKTTTKNPLYINKHKEKSHPQKTNIFNAVKPTDYQKSVTTPPLQPQHAQKRDTKNIEIKEDIPTYTNRRFITYEKKKKKNPQDRILPTLTTEESCKIRLARYSNSQALKQQIIRLPEALRKEVRLYRENKTVVATTIAYPNRAVATSKLNSFKHVFKDAFIQHVQRVRHPKPEKHTTATPNTSNSQTSSAMVTTEGVRVQLAKATTHTTLQEKVHTLPSSLQHDVRIFKENTHFIATTILYPNQTIAQSKLLAFQTIFKGAYITNADITSAPKATRPRDHTLLSTLNLFNTSEKTATDAQKQSRGTSNESFFDKLNPFSASENTEEESPEVPVTPTTADATQPTHTKAHNDPLSAPKGTYYVIRLAKYTNKSNLIKNIGKLDKHIRSSVLLFQEETFYIAHSQPFTTKEEALRALPMYKKIFRDAYVKTIDTSQSYSKKTPPPATTHSSSTPPQKEKVSKVEESFDNVAPPLNFTQYTYATMQKEHLNAQTQSTASYTIQLGKYRNKKRLEQQVKKLGRALNKKVQIRKENDYYIASSLPYPLKLTAQQEVVNFKKVFQDAFIQTHAPLIEAPKKEHFTKTRFNHRDFKGVKTPETLIFKKSKTVLRNFGTSQVHGKVHYLSSIGKPLKLKNVRAYLIEKDKTITQWYTNYYLKNKKSGSLQQMVVNYITSTTLSLDNSFSFYGVAQGEYCLIVRADYPRNIAKNQHVYLAKMLEVGEFKKLSTRFTKQI